MAAKTVTAIADAQIDTAQSKFGGASALFDGTGDYLQIESSTDWDFGSGDFTIDFWFRPTADQVMALFAPLTDHKGVAICYSLVGVNNISLCASNDGINWNILTPDIGGGELANGANGTITPAAWNHVAWVRFGDRWITFINGVKDLDITKAGTVHYTDETKSIGRWGDDAILKLSGHIDEFRISKGIARWTSNFTPPTGPHTPDSDTKLLLHMDGADGSTSFSDSSADAPVLPSTSPGFAYRFNHKINAY